MHCLVYRGEATPGGGWSHTQGRGREGARGETAQASMHQRSAAAIHLSLTPSGPAVRCCSQSPDTQHRARSRGTRGGTQMPPPVWITPGNATASHKYMANMASVTTPKCIAQ